MTPRVLIVIPAHNEERSIRETILGLRRAAPDFDRMVVNDGSLDATEGILKKMGEDQLRLHSNLGYSSALVLGMKHMLRNGYDAVVFFDADGQHLPESVPDLTSHLLRSGADMVIGSRYCEGEASREPLRKQAVKRLLSWLTTILTGKRIYDTTSGLKAINRDGCEVLLEGVFMDLHAEAIVRLSMNGLDVREYPVKMQDRLHGASMYSLTRALKYPVYTVLLTLLASVDSLLRRRNS